MNALEIVTFVVTLGAALVCLIPAFRPGRALAEAGRQGMIWFERGGDRPLGDQPSEDSLDAPLPHRPLRTRF